MARILVIDDESAIRGFLRQILERAGYIVSEAANGREAQKVFSTEPADLIISDIIMPEKEGLETIMDFKRNYPSVKIIGISGGGKSSPEDYLKIASRFGAHKTFSKPFERNEILAAVRELLSE